MSLQIKSKVSQPWHDCQLGPGKSLWELPSASQMYDIPGLYPLVLTKKKKKSPEAAKGLPGGKMDPS